MWRWTVWGEVNIGDTVQESHYCGVVVAKTERTSTRPFLYSINVDKRSFGRALVCLALRDERDPVQVWRG